MARVPYTPDFTAQPQSPGERVQVQTPGAAFGENIGAALQHLGTTTEQVGGELFTRAMALQELSNQNNARAAQTDFATQSSELHAQYNALTGKAAAEGLQPYLQSQAKLRTDIRTKLGSPMAQQYYDADSLPFMQRNVFSAAGHAADENKKYTVDTLNATANIAINSTSQYPDDEGYFAKNQATVKDSLTQAAMLHFGTDDPNSPVVQNYVKDGLSKQITERIIGKAKIDPIGANEMFKQFGDQLTAADNDRVQGTIETKGAAVGGVNIANQIYNHHRQPDGTYDVTTKQMQDEARAAAKEMLPENAMLPDVAVGKLDGLINQDRYSGQRDVFDAKQSVFDAISKNDVQDVQHLLAIPGMDKVVEKLPPKDRNDLQGYINRYQAAATKQSNEYWVTSLNGMRNSDSAAFMSVDPTDPQYHLGKADILRVQNQQAELAKNPQGDPRVSRALTWIKGARGQELQALQIYQRDKNNPDDYDHFVGALQEAIDIYGQDHPGKQPTYEEVIDKIAPQIISTTATNKGWLFNSQEPAFKQFNRPEIQDVPDEFKQQVTQDVIKKGGVAPTDAQLVQAYARMQFQKLYAGSAKTDAETPQSK